MQQVAQIPGFCSVCIGLHPKPPISLNLIPSIEIDRRGVPGIFLQVLLIQSVLVYHQAAFQPSQEDETVAPFVFNCGWLGHGKNSVGGSSLTFLREHHKNHSRKTVIGTKQMSQTEQQRKAPDTRQRHLSDESVRYKTCIAYFSF